MEIPNTAQERQEQLESLKLFFDSIELPTSIVLSNCEVISDVRKFTQSHLSVVAHNIEKERLVLPYLARLIKVKTILAKREQERKRMNKAA